jgi:single-stranded DNA-binding protein
MMTAAIYGRLGGDPKRLETNSGKLMVVGSMAVTLPMRDEEHTTWMGLVAFGKAAEALNRQEKGDLVSVSGRCQMNIWNDGAKQQMQVVDSIVSAGSIRPGGRAPAGKQKAEDFDDDLAF